jgi:hypothetical protein
MEPDVLSQCSRKLATLPYSEPHEINPRPFFDIVLILFSWSPRRLALPVIQFYCLTTLLGPLSSLKTSSSNQEALSAATTVSTQSLVSWQGNLSVATIVSTQFLVSWQKNFSVATTVSTQFLVHWQGNLSAATNASTKSLVSWHGNLSVATTVSTQPTTQWTPTDRSPNLRHFLTHLMPLKC